MEDDARVKDIMELITREAPIVHENSPLLNVLEEMVKDPKTQSVYVVDKDGKLCGIITMSIALQYLYYPYIPPEYLEFDISVVEGVNALARDVMLPPIYVREEDSLKDAFQKMFEYHLQEIPVVDNDLHVVGDLHGMELIQGWLESRRE